MNQLLQGSGFMAAAINLKFDIGDPLADETDRFNGNIEPLMPLETTREQDYEFVILPVALPLGKNPPPGATFRGRAHMWLALSKPSNALLNGRHPAVLIALKF